MVQGPHFSLTRQNRDRLNRSPSPPIRVLSVIFLLLMITSQSTAASFVRGDSTGDGRLNVADAVLTLNYLFLGASLPNCRDAADTNDDGAIGIADAIYVLMFLFMSGDHPAKPFPEPDYDPTPDDPFLECDSPRPPSKHGFYRASELQRPRYEHEAVTLHDGRVLIVGGSDERLFTAIDVAEIFDQALVSDPAPPCGFGGWIDTDFEGEPLTLNGGGRVFHTATLMDPGYVVVGGGAQDTIQGELNEHVEIFDQHTRKFITMENGMNRPRLHHTAHSSNRETMVIFGGQIYMNITIVDPNYPPSDPRFLREIKTYPSTADIEIYDATIPSEDGLGQFIPANDARGQRIELPGDQGRAGHETVRLAGPDDVLGNEDDVWLQVGGIRTLSPAFAPRLNLPRVDPASAKLESTIDIYSTAADSAFVAPGVALEKPRTHGHFVENVGWFSDVTHDGMNGLSNVFLVAGGSDDVLPTTGVLRTEGFSVRFSGFGPGSGVTVTRTEPGEEDTIDSCIENVLDSATDGRLIALAYDTSRPAYQDFLDPRDGLVNPLLDYSRLASGIQPDLSRSLGAEVFAVARLGKYFGMEGYFSRQRGLVSCPISRVHTEAVHLVRSVQTVDGPRLVGTIFTGGGGFMYKQQAQQRQYYDELPIASGEYFDPTFNLVNAFFTPQRKPADLSAVRGYWSKKLDIPLPEPANTGRHPNPTGSEGAWLLADGFLPQDGFEGYQWLPPYTNDEGHYIVHGMEKGRAWHTLSLVPGTDLRLETPDDCVLFAGGGNDVMNFGGEPVIPSAIVYMR